MGGEDGLEVVACRGAHELTAFTGEQIGDGARVSSLESCAGQDHRASVHFLRLEAGLLVRAGDEPLQLVDVDQPVRAVGREQHR